MSRRNRYQPPAPARFSSAPCSVSRSALDASQGGNAMSQESSNSPRKGRRGKGVQSPASGLPRALRRRESPPPLRRSAAPGSPPSAKGEFHGWPPPRTPSRNRIAQGPVRGSSLARTMIIYAPWDDHLWPNPAENGSGSHSVSDDHLWRAEGAAIDARPLAMARPKNCGTPSAKYPRVGSNH